APKRARSLAGKLGWIEVRDGHTSPMISVGTYLVEAMTPDGRVQQQTVTVAPKVPQTVRFQ
ncbi:MAG TPA: hypothetical protein PLS53_03415, partial [Thermoanaerobaculaceae bacterium]|nr:hypothetical protein [Thermoanaerobaculaceae bacterium]